MFGKINTKITLNSLVSRTSENGIGSALSYQYFSALAFTVSGAIFYIVVAKILPTYDLGAISLLIAISNILNILFSFGFPTAAQHFISFHMGKGDRIETYSIAKRLITMSAVLSIASLVFTLLTARFFAIVFFHNPYDTYLVEAASIYVAGSILFGVFHGTALGFQIFRIDALIYLSSVSFSYFLGLALLLVFHGIIFLLVGIAICYFSGSGMYIIYMFYKRPSIRERSYKTSLQSVFSYSWPVVLSGMLGVGASYVDRFVVAWFLNLSTLGVYSFVLLIASSLSFLSGPITNILLPKLSEYFSTHQNEKLSFGVNLSSTILILIYAPIALGVAAIGPIVLTWLAEPVYASGSIALIVLLGISSIFVLSGVLTSMILAVRKTRVYVVITALTLVSNVALSFLLIPKLGMLGAAISNSSVSVVAFVVLYYYAKMADLKNFDWVTILRIWLSSLGMFFLVTVERIEMGNFARMLPLYILSGGAIYVVLVNLTHSLRRMKKDEFLSLVPTKFGLQRIIKILLARAF